MTHGSFRSTPASGVVAAAGFVGPPLVGLKFTATASQVRGPTSAAYAERTKGGERAITNRLHGGHDALAAQGPTPLVDRVMAVLKLSVVPREVPCRGTHEKAIRDLLLLRIRTGASEMVYIAGQPGTGKTLTVLRVVETLIAMRDKDKLPYVRRDACSFV